MLDLIIDLIFTYFKCNNRKYLWLDSTNVYHHCHFSAALLLQSLLSHYKFLVYIFFKLAFILSYGIIKSKSESAQQIWVDLDHHFAFRPLVMEILQPSQIFMLHSSVMSAFTLEWLLWYQSFCHVGRLEQKAHTYIKSSLKS